MPLANYAVSTANSKGRLYEIEQAHDRNPFARDKARIIHSAAFRCLQGKTQVFGHRFLHEKHRTRLTHSLEVAQVARSIAASLDLNEDLAETLALAHDIGHAPFGHSGQDTLDELLKDHGGFEHNMQTLRIGTELESTYLEHDGLNLTYETLEGMLKHCTAERAKQLSEDDNPFYELLGRRFIEGKSPSLESQIVDFSDAIAYLHADMEDAIHLGLITPKQMSDRSPKFSKFWARAQMDYFDFNADDPKLIHEVIRNMMRQSIMDLVENSRLAIESSGIQTLDDVRNSQPLITFGINETREHKILKEVSRDLIYNHPSVIAERVDSIGKLRQVFDAYITNPDLIRGFDSHDKRDVHRQAADAIVGLTDGDIDIELIRIQAAKPTAVRKPKR
jgi:dGTPase